MKLLVVFASLLVAISAVSEEQAWSDFKQTHSKVYRNLREEKLRFEIFKSNLEKISEHNARFDKAEESYTLAVNQFADLTSEEFKEMYLGYKKPLIEIVDVFSPSNNYTAAASVDWRAKGAVLSVRNQGQCGSCWAFSAVGSMEGQNAIKKGKKIELSEQELVDCSGSFGNEGCNGGLMDYSFKYVQADGIATRASYPYVGARRTCGRTTHARADIKVTGYRGVGASENALQAAIDSVGPISVAVDADKFQLYGSGVFDDSNCGRTLNHGVLAVGYGSAGGKDFYIVKNSWGASWGESGYIKMSRNKNNQCGIATEASYPIVA